MNPYISAVFVERLFEIREYLFLSLCQFARFGIAVRHGGDEVFVTKDAEIIKSSHRYI